MYVLREIRIHHHLGDGKVISDTYKLNKEPEIQSESNPMPDSITELMRPKDKEGKDQYFKRHRYHFNRSLSEYAVSQLQFVDSLAECINYDSLLGLMKTYEIELPEKSTQSDLYYVINKIRAEHTLETVKTDFQALRLAVECLENPNIREGEIFLQWIEHMYRIKKDIFWNKFMD